MVGNCVEVGDALETVAENVSMEIYAVHRNIYETQDPLGNENVDQRFRDRYGFYAPQFKPPVAGINGKYALQGATLLAILWNRTLQTSDTTSKSW